MNEKIIRDKYKQTIEAADNFIIKKTDNELKPANEDLHITESKEQFMIDIENKLQHDRTHFSIEDTQKSFQPFGILKEDSLYHAPSFPLSTYECYPKEA